LQVDKENKQELQHQIQALETEQERLVADTQLWRTDKINQLTKELSKQTKEHQTQLRKINLLFDHQAEHYKTIDFNGLYSLLAKTCNNQKLTQQTLSSIDNYLDQVENNNF